MDLPRNRFKAALAEGRHQLGIWNSIGGPTVVEALAASGFDWVLIDTEHAPVGVTDVLPALQAVAGYPEVSAIVRPAGNDTVAIKRLLDLGAQTLLVPFVQTRAEAEAAVAATRYPPNGIRGVAGSTRASRFGKIPDYASRADGEICLLVQVETASAMEQLEQIASVEGVHGVFIGPSDLSASMGFPGQPNHPKVRAVIEDAFDRLKRIGVPAGILTLDETYARRAMELGTGFTAVGVDLALLLAAVSGLRGRFEG